MRMVKKHSDSLESISYAETTLHKESRVGISEKIALLSDLFSKVILIDSITKKVVSTDDCNLKETGRECSRDCPLAADSTGCICKDAVSASATRQKFTISGATAYLVVTKPVVISNRVYNLVIIDKIDTSFAFGTTEVGESVTEITKISSSLVIDQLTQIYNRKYLEDNNGYWVESACKTGQEMCLCSIDIDNFKRFNDSYGHDFGDKVLRTLAESMQEAIEGMNKTYPIRVGGDEFLIICINGMQKKRFIAAMNKLCIIVKGKELDFNGQKVGITISAGVSAVLEDNVQTYKELYEMADKALYRAKEAGKNCVR